MRRTHLIVNILLFSFPLYRAFARVLGHPDVANLKKVGYLAARMVGKGRERMSRCCQMSWPLQLEVATMTGPAFRAFKRRSSTKCGSPSSTPLILFLLPVPNSTNLSCKFQSWSGNALWATKLFRLHANSIAHLYVAIYPSTKYIPLSPAHSCWWCCFSAWTAWEQIA